MNIWCGMTARLCHSPEKIAQNRRHGFDRCVCIRWSRVAHISQSITARHDKQYASSYCATLSSTRNGILCAHYMHCYARQLCFLSSARPNRKTYKNPFAFISPPTTTSPSQRPYSITLFAVLSVVCTDKIKFIDFIFMNWNSLLVSFWQRLLSHRNASRNRRRRHTKSTQFYTQKQQQKLANDWQHEQHKTLFTLN